MKLTLFSPCHKNKYNKNNPRQISQQLLTLFWPNFKNRFLGTSRTDSNSHSVICPCNICPCNICPCNICPCNIYPYQEYLSYYWLNFDQTLKVGSWEHPETVPTVMVTFVQATYMSWWDLLTSAISQLLLTRFWSNFFGS